MDSKRMWSMNESYNEIEQKEEDLYVPVNTVTSPTTEPVASGVTKQTTYKFLYKKSTVFLGKSSTTRHKTVYNSKVIHDQSTGYQEDLGFCRVPTQSSSDIFFDICLNYLLEHN